MKDFQGLVADLRQSVQPEPALIFLPGLKCSLPGQELQSPVVHPAALSFDGGAETEQALAVAICRIGSVGGVELDSDGRIVGYHPAGAGFDIITESLCRDVVSPAGGHKEAEHGGKDEVGQSVHFHILIYNRYIILCRLVRRIVCLRKYIDMYSQMYQGIFKKCLLQSAEKSSRNVCHFVTLHVVAQPLTHQSADRDGKTGPEMTI